MTGGCDNLVKIWSYNEDSSCSWVLEETLHGHRDWVRDVAWAPSVGLPLSTIASCSQVGLLSKADLGGGGDNPSPQGLDPLPTDPKMFLFFPQIIIVATDLILMFL